MASISSKTWAGPAKKRKSRATRRKDLDLREGSFGPGLVGFSTGGHTTRRRVLVINPETGGFTAFIDQGWTGKNIYLPRKIGFSMFLSLIKQGKYP